MKQSKFWKYYNFWKFCKEVEKDCSPELIAQRFGIVLKAFEEDKPPVETASFINKHFKIKNE